MDKISRKSRNNKAREIKAKNHQLGNKKLKMLPSNKQISSTTITKFNSVLNQFGDNSELNYSSDKENSPNKKRLNIKSDTFSSTIKDYFSAVNKDLNKKTDNNNCLSLKSNKNIEKKDTSKEMTRKIAKNMSSRFSTPKKHNKQISTKSPSVRDFLKSMNNNELLNERPTTSLKSTDADKNNFKKEIKLQTARSTSSTSHLKTINKKVKSQKETKAVEKPDKTSIKKNIKREKITKDKNNESGLSIVKNHQENKKSTAKRLQSVKSFFTQENSQTNKDEKKRNLINSKLSENSDLLLPKPSKNVLKKNNKLEKKEMFEKYHVSVPSLEEILKDKKDLNKCKNYKIESLKSFEEESFEPLFDFDTTDKIIEADLLDCHHLDLDYITKGFKKNLMYLTNVLNGTVYNARHNKFYSKTYQPSIINNWELTNSPSTLVFTFEQKEYMLYLLRKEFDPKDELTMYFFQVLLPELCLKIFMDAHEMSYDWAVEYLDKRPLTKLVL